MTTYRTANDGKEATAVLDGMTCVAGPKVLAPDATAGGKTLETLNGAALNANLKAIMFIPAEGATVNWAETTASATDEVMVAQAVPMTKAYADTLKFFSAASHKFSIKQFA